MRKPFRILAVLFAALALAAIRLNFEHGTEVCRLYRCSGWVGFLPIMAFRSWQGHCPGVPRTGHTPLQAPPDPKSTRLDWFLINDRILGKVHVTS